MEEYKIKFYPDEKEVYVDRGTDLLTAAMKAGIHIYNSCGGEGVCGRCKVIIKKGEINTELSGRLTTEERKLGYVLACRTTPKSDLEVEVPIESRLGTLEILTEEAKAQRLAGLYTPAERVEEEPKRPEERIFTHGPLSTKIYLELPLPTLEDNIGDMDRLFRELRKGRSIPIMQMGLANIKRLSRLLRESNWKVTVTLGNRNQTAEIVLIEPGNRVGRNSGIALDIGTTTIVAYLVNLDTQQVLGAKASFNPQVDFGEDVISRIIYAQEEGGLEKLHHVVIDTVNDLIYSLIKENNLTLDDITAGMAAGNTTMTHLLLKIEPTFIRKDPYIPVVNFMPVIRAAEAGIKINPRGLLSCLPCVSSYVGGDITAGVLASGMDTYRTLSLFIDMGTNGEVVLGNRDWLICCSTSAGPCFEGGGIKYGVRAMQGAIQKISLKPDSEEIGIDAIGGQRPRGICGSGIVSAISELLKAGIIDRQGKIKGDKFGRVRERDGYKEFVLVKSSDSELNMDITIDEVDIKNVIYSKGAIFTGAELILRETGYKFKDLEHIFIAGGLGTALDIESAIILGLLPDLPKERFRFLGNTSITGAKMCLLSSEAMLKAENLAKKMTYIDLSSNPEFMNNYTGALFLPHTNIELFPSVKGIL